VEIDRALREDVGVNDRAVLAADLGALEIDEWPVYLAAHSGLPGPRANLTLVQAFGDVAEAATVIEYAGRPDEYLALCGTAALGRLLGEDDGRIESFLRARAADARWRVREGVAMALQTLGDRDPSALFDLADRWLKQETATATATDAASLLTLRAVAAGVAEPRLVKGEAAALAGQNILNRIMELLVAVPIGERRSEGFRVLQKALGYCWSVVVPGAPGPGFDALERWARSGDPAAAQIVRVNLTKTRLRRVDPVRVATIGAS
jgi:hypothetical protein